MPKELEPLARQIVGQRAVIGINAVVNVCYTLEIIHFVLVSLIIFEFTLFSAQP